MERVSFLIEATGARLACLLNPESLVVRRLAGVRPRRSAAGALAGAALSDDPLIHTGGGRTELELDLLFDVTLGGGSVATEDVRDLTGPLWSMAETAATGDGRGRTAVVRFVWGKSWNVPGVVVAVAERLENFTPEGVARRSWLRLRLRRVAEPARAGGPGPRLLPTPRVTPEALAGLTAEALPVRALGGGGSPAGAERLDSFLARHRVPPRHWKLVARLNDVDDPLRLPAAMPLRLPPPGLLGEGG